MVTPRRPPDLVLGSGVAGLTAAILLAESGREVVVLTKDAPADSSTDRAQGGVAVALSDDDRIELHFEDTIRAGAGLTEESPARVLVEEGPAGILRLIEWGAEFDRKGVALAFGMEAAHSAPRVIHARGDATGREIVRALLDRARALPGLEVRGGWIARDLIVEGGVCRGADAVDASGRDSSLRARHVLLATGGAATVYRDHTNPPQATGDGVAMAWSAGAELMDLEFVQFHPTALAVAGHPRHLLTEALRGEGAVLRDAAGRRFLADIHPDAELAPRDAVSRAIAMHLAATGEPCVWLDLTHLDSEFVGRRFPGIREMCASIGLDLARERIPVAPAAHYFMGGVRSDLEGRTTVPGLYVAGEVACTGLHGANRLASNSLLEGIVFGARAAGAMRADERFDAGTRETTVPESPFDDGAAGELTAEVAEIASRGLGIVRDGAGLRSALEGLETIGEGGRRSGGAEREGIEARNRWIVARAIAEAALRREESRGAHYRSDRPHRDDVRFWEHTVSRRGEAPRGVPVGRGCVLSESG